MFLLNLFGLNSLIGFITVLVALYFYLTRHFKYWKSRGINGPKPYAGIGTIYQIFARDLFSNNWFNVEKYGQIHGTFLGDRPVLMVSQPEYIKDMTIKDFHLFVDRNDLVTGDPMQDRSLFNLFGDDWKKMRSIISPTFSSGKMRNMHPIIIDCVKRLEIALDKNIAKNSEVEIKQLMANFTIDVIATCAFGTKIDTYDEKKNEFIINAQKAFRGTWRLWVFFTLAFVCPKLIQKFKIQFVDPAVTDFFRSAIRKIISNREAEGGKHKDYIQLMINARNKVADNDEHENEEDSKDDLFRQSDDKNIKNNSKFKGEVTEDDILATSFIFFVAGYETTAATLSNMLYSLATNEKCQQKLYEELESYGPEFNYEDIAKMPYLEACVAETLRLYNPLSATSRIASEDYKIGDTGITLEKGIIVQFDIHSVHHNPKYYPEPNKWDPQRFMPENRDKLVPYTYMPFGMGPRNCVGMRFALMEAKTAAAYLIYKYRLFKSANTQPKLIRKKYEVVLTHGEIRIGFEHRNQSNSGLNNGFH